MNTKTGNKGILHVLFGILLIITFFLPWVSWEGSAISGYSMPLGDFFATSGSKFGLDNPFPQFNFTFLIFWLIPVLSIASILFSLQKKKSFLFAAIAGALSLSLVVVFILFTKTLLTLGVGKGLVSMLTPWIYLHAIAAIGFVFTATGGNTVKKLVWVIIGPVFAFAGFMFIENYLAKETYKDTADVKADYSVSATDLIREFAANDTSANNKYREKIIAVNGIVSQVEIKLDSTVNVKFVDTTKHFINFPLEKSDFEKTKSIKAGDNISLKGSCSGSDYSMILDSTSINFKRATLNK